MDDLSYKTSDDVESIQRKLNLAKSRLSAEESQKDSKRSPLYEAYLEFSARVFTRDLAKRASA